MKQLKLLLIRRGSFPYKDAWALPGGFVRKGESVPETAKRELHEETGVEDAYLRPFDIFSEEGRNPRGWIISHAFLALIDGEKYRVHEGSDAWEARWFQIKVESDETKRHVSASHAQIERIYTLRLNFEESDDLSMTATIVFDLMPERFTLTELQHAFESVLNKPLLVANFRRKMADYVLETDDAVEGAGHRPAKLFRRNVERFYQ